jgi:hypothetical protein
MVSTVHPWVMILKNDKHSSIDLTNLGGLDLLKAS